MGFRLKVWGFRARRFQFYKFLAGLGFGGVWEPRSGKGRLGAGKFEAFWELRVVAVWPLVMFDLATRLSELFWGAFWCSSWVYWAGFWVPTRLSESPFPWSHGPWIPKPEPSTV